MTQLQRNREPGMTTPTPYRSTSSLAVISLVCGILGWTLLPFLGGLIAIVTGHMARKELRLRAELDGDGLALTGLVLGYAALATVVIGGLSILSILLLFGRAALLGMSL